MTDFPSDIMESQTPPSGAGATRRCRHPREYRYLEPPDVRCGRCSAIIDEARARRGKNNRARGNSIEREIARRMGLQRVGQYGGPEDVGGANAAFIAQVKSKAGAAFPSWMLAELDKLPRNAGQTPLLVVAQGLVQGRRRRVVVVVDFDDWVALHGPAA